MVDMDTLRKVPVPAKEGRWCPLPHHELVDEAIRGFTANKLMVKEATYALNHEGRQFFGLLSLITESAQNDWNLIVGLRNSHDKSFSASLCCGNRVMVCDNLAFTGEVQLVRKHTTNIMADLPCLMMRAIGRFNELRGIQEKRIDLYKQTMLAEKDVHDLLVRSVKIGFLPVTKLPAVLGQWEHPTFPEFAEQPNLWRLQNAFTEVQKESNIFSLPKNQLAMHALLDVAAGFVGRDFADDTE
jgi:hypothetical protein